MRKPSLLLFCAITCLGLCVCTRPEPIAGREMQYDDAKALFSVDMTFDRTREKFGPPTNILSDKEYVYWSYVPFKTPGAHVVGFEIWFRAGKSQSLHQIEVTRN